jgi:hypothetical protein
MNDSKSTLVLVPLAIVGGLLFFIINWWPMFTGADAANEPHIVAPSYTKEQAARTARKFAAANGMSPSAESSVIHQSDNALSGYLQKNGYYERYAQNYKMLVPIDYYQAEVRDIDSGLRQWVDINMDTGRVIGWNKEIEYGEPVEREVARSIAQSALIEMGYDPKDFNDVGQDDYAPDMFILEKKGAVIGQATLQLHIEVLDDQVVYFQPLFTIPEDYTAWAGEQQSSSSIMGLISLILSFIMAVAAVVIAIRYRQAVSFTRGIILTSVFAIAYSLNNINMYPGFKAISVSGDPFTADTAAIFMVVFMSLITLLMAAAVYWAFVAGAGMAQARDSMNDLWPRWSHPLFGHEVLIGMGRGYLICLFLLGVQAVLFLLAERHFNVWSTNDPASSPYNMFWPVLFPLMAWAAAISEEAIYRLFGIFALKKLVRSSFLAILITSMIWALGHTSYPIYPVYTRFVEVTILGIIFGYVFLKYGFITALFAHAIMDTILMSFSLMSLGGVFNGLMGLAYIVSPAAIAYVIYLLHQRLKGKRPPVPHPAAR